MLTAAIKILGKDEVEFLPANLDQLYGRDISFLGLEIPSSFELYLARHAATK